MNRIQDADGWRWYVAPDGRYYVSVTRAMEHIVPEHLKDWWRKNSANKTDKHLKMAQDWGTDVHSLVEQEFRGTLTEIPAQYETPWNMWQDLKSKHDLKIEKCELVVHNEDYGYAGSLDYILRYKGKPCIADLKTGNSFSVKTGWQLAAYKAAYEKMTGEKDLGMIGIHIPRDKAIGRLFVYQHYDFCFQTYLACLQTFKGLYFSKLNKMGWPWLKEEKNAA